jgi:hypothetical protein
MTLSKEEWETILRAKARQLSDDEITQEEVMADLVELLDIQDDLPEVTKEELSAVQFEYLEEP